MIESLSNPKIKYAVKLKQKKYRQAYNQFLVEGEHLVIEAQKAGLIDHVFATESWLHEGYETILVSDKVMDRLSELKTGRRLLAVCHKPSFNHLSHRILMLDGVQDPGNMGTLIRSAAAFGFNTIVSEASVDYYNDKVIRSSQGAIFYVQLIEASLLDFIADHPEYSYISTDVQMGECSYDVAFNQLPFAIILGNEGSGVRTEIQSRVKKHVNIPMKDTESLNVGVAGSILMYEAYKEDKDGL